MFHVARALLYTRGYREKSHYCLAVGLRHLFMSHGELAPSMVRDTDDPRALREDADYRAELSQIGA